MADEQRGNGQRNEGQLKPEPSIRKKRQMERMAKVRKAREVPRVRVIPRDDEVRAVIKHPRAGAFRSSGSMEWPHDTFTRRRVRDGTVKLETSRERQDETSRHGRTRQHASEAPSA
jgi:hypothetical protein